MLPWPTAIMGHGDMRSIAELVGVQGGIDPVECDEIGVIAIFDNLTFLYDQDAICTPYGAQTMRNDDAGAITQ